MMEMSQQKNSRINTNRAGQDETSRHKFRLFILPLLLLFCTLFYYFGELVDWATWEPLRLKFFYGIHDVHRLLFLAPIIYAGYHGRVKGAVIVTIVSFMVFLPRAFFISPYPDPILRMIFFTVVGGTIGVLTGIIRNKSEQQTQLETLLARERDKWLGILTRMEDGVILTGADYKVLFVNPSMIRDFGEGIGSYCYQYLHNLDRPCEACKLPSVIGGEVARWEYAFPDGRVYEVMASTYTDSNGMVCQLATFRNITHRKKVNS
jgi:PAS domain-containing protein